MKNLKQQFSKYNKSLEKTRPQYSALLGKTKTIVEHPTRNGFCYARMADNLNELIVVFNDKVSQAYNLPVLVSRRGNTWYVVGRDTQRYQDWGSDSSFLPKHARQHEFNRDDGTGADTVFVYPDQMIPLLVYPSGTSGAGNVMIAPYLLQRTSDFIYVGNTGTRNLLIYKPTNNQGIMGLVYMDKTTGNPGFLVASGTPFAGSITGTAALAQYAPYPSSNQEPLYFVRLVSGTTAIQWENLYNARQFIGGSAGGSSLPIFITGSIPFSSPDGTLGENNQAFFWNTGTNSQWIGNRPPTPLQIGTVQQVLTSPTPNTSSVQAIAVYGTGTSGNPSPLYNGYRSRGTLAAPTPVQTGDILIGHIGSGYDGANFMNSTRIAGVANANWITGSNTESRLDFEVTPSGTTTRTTQFQIYGNNVNIPTGSTYNIGGVPVPGGVEEAPEDTIARARRDAAWDYIGIRDVKGPGGGFDVFDGSFDSDADWLYGAGVAITGGQAVFTASSSYLQRDPAPLNPGEYYYIVFDLVVTSGSIQFDDGVTTSQVYDSTQTVNVFWKGTGSGMNFVPSAFTGTIDNLSVSSVGLFYTIEDYLVKVRDNQTVAGVKTFTSFPVTPSSAPTTDYQVANKKYVDDNIGGGGVATVTGDGVDNTDPANPVMTFPTPADIGAQVAGSYLTSANIEDAINNGTTDKAPSENAVFDALAGKAATSQKLDDFGTPDDNTDLNANTTNHGLLLKATAPAAGLLNIVSIINGATIYALVDFATWVRSALLTGFSEGAGTVAATDTVLQAFNKLVGNIALKAAIAQEAWTLVTGGIGYENSWVDYGGAGFQVRYYKDTLGNVHLSGIMKSGTINATAFTLPSGYRPEYEIYGTCITSALVLGIWKITAAGVFVPVSGSNTYFYVDNIHFRAV